MRTTTTDHIVSAINGMGIELSLVDTSKGRFWAADEDGARFALALLDKLDDGGRPLWDIIAEDGRSVLGEPAMEILGIALYTFADTLKGDPFAVYACGSED